jgi:hypothetical protein
MLQVGDLLRSHDGQWLPVQAVTDSGEVTTVYNLRVAEYHTYFVGSRDWGFSVWSHNANYTAGQAQQFERELAQNPSGGWGLGLFHRPTGDVHLAPFDAFGGHDAFAQSLGHSLQDFFGFLLHQNPNGTFQAINISGLNTVGGGGMAMPGQIFADILQALKSAGLAL